MRKLMLLAAMLAMVLVAAAPAFAQNANAALQYGDENLNQQQAASIVQDCSTNVTAQYTGDVYVTGAECQAIINQTQAGEDAIGAVTAVLGDVEAAPAAEEEAAPADDGEEVVASEDAVDNDADGVVDEADGSEEAADEEVEAAADDTAVLPDTGGASLFTLGAGALLVGGGLLARRIFS